MNIFHLHTTQTTTKKREKKLEIPLENTCDCRTLNPSTLATAAAPPSGSNPLPCLLHQQKLVLLLLHLYCNHPEYTLHTAHYTSIFHCLHALLAAESGNQALLTVTHTRQAARVPAAITLVLGKLTVLLCFYFFLPFCLPFLQLKFIYISQRLQILLYFSLFFFFLHMTVRIGRSYANFFHCKLQWVDSDEVEILLRKKQKQHRNCRRSSSSNAHRIKS